MSSLASATTDAAPSSSSSSLPDKLGLKTSSNLYLITFLATLFLLLFISCTIVLRSFIIRRRFQRQIDDAFAAGIILAPRAQGSRKQRYGHRPKMFTSRIAQGGEKWNEMMPVSILPLQAKRRCKTPSNHNHCQQTLPSPNVSTSLEPRRFQHRMPGLRAFHQRDQINPRVPTTAPPEKSSSVSVKVDLLQVAVLIAMPSPNNPLSHPLSSVDKLSEEEDEQLPDVVFGVTRLPFKHSNQII